MGWVTVGQLLCRGSYARPAPTSCVSPMLSVVLTTGRISTIAYFEHTIQARLTKNVRMSLSIQKVCAFTEWSIGSVYTTEGDKSLIVVKNTHYIGVCQLHAIPLSLLLRKSITAILSRPSACVSHT